MATPVEIKVQLSGQQAVAAGLRTTASAFNTLADGTVGQFQRVSGAFLNLQNLVVAGSAAMAARAIIAPAIDIETARTQFAILLGDAQKASGFVQQLLDFSARTPLQFGDIQATANALLAAGVAANSVVPLMQQLGDVAQGDAGKLQSVTHAYVMMKNSGKVTLEQLNVLMNAGIPIVDELGTAMGKTSSQIMAMVSRGQLGFGDLRTAMDAMTGPGGRYQGMMERMSATTAGRLSTMADNWKMARAEIGEQVLPALGKAIDDISRGIQELSDSGQLQEWGKDAAAAVTAVWNAVQGLADFISRNKDTIVMTAGLYAGVTAWRALVDAVKAAETALVAYGVVAARVPVAQAAANAASLAASAQGVVAGTQSIGQYAAAVQQAETAASGLRGALSLLGRAIGAVSAVGVVAFAGWKIGELIADISGLREAIVNLGEARAEAGISVDENGDDVVAPPDIETAQAGWLARRRKDLQFPGLEMDQALQLKNNEGQDFAAWWRDLQAVQAGKPTERSPEKQAELDAEKADRDRLGRLSAMREKLEQLRQEAWVSQQAGEPESPALLTWRALTSQQTAPKESVGDVAASAALDRATAAGQGDWTAGLEIIARRAALRESESIQDQWEEQWQKEVQNAKDHAAAVRDLSELTADAYRQASERELDAIEERTQERIRALKTDAELTAGALRDAESMIDAANKAIALTPSEREKARNGRDDDDRADRKVQKRIDNAIEREAAGLNLSRPQRDLLRAWRGQMRPEDVAVADEPVARAARIGAGARRDQAQDKQIANDDANRAADEKLRDLDRRRRELAERNRLEQADLLWGDAVNRANQTEDPNALPAQPPQSVWPPPILPPEPPPVRTSPPPAPAAAPAEPVRTPPAPAPAAATAEPVRTPPPAVPAAAPAEPVRTPPAPAQTPAEEIRLARNESIARALGLRGPERLGPGDQSPLASAATSPLGDITADARASISGQIAGLTAAIDGSAFDGIIAALRTQTDLLRENVRATSRWSAVGAS
jgi:tape measure domain-containing protein